MYARPTPFVSEENAFALFDLLEDHAYDTLQKYLTSHGWDDEAKRLKESRFIGVGAYRLLTRLSLDYLNGSPEDLVSFYERCKRPKDDPHYEDLITTILLSFVVNIISNYCYDAIKNSVPDLHHPKRLARRLREEFGPALNYLLRAQWLRQEYWNKKVSKETHDLVLHHLSVRYLARAVRSGGRTDSKVLVEMEVKFESAAKRHGLDLKDLENSLIRTLTEKMPGPEELADVVEGVGRLLKEKETPRADRQDRRVSHGVDEADDRQASDTPEGPRRVQRRARKARKRDRP